MNKSTIKMNKMYFPYRFSIILLVVWLFSGHEVVAGDELIKTEYNYRKYTVRDGLPEMLCYALRQDSKGFIWIGTLNGCARYDGHTFQSFLTGVDVGIFGFHEDIKGNMLGISYRQQIKVLSGSDTIYYRKKYPSLEVMYSEVNSRSMPNGYGVYQAGYGNPMAIYAYTDTMPVKIWQHDAISKMSVHQKPYWDRNGNQFLIPTLKGTYVIDEDGIVRDSFAITTINCFVPHKGCFWAVADDGLYEYNNRNLKRVLDYPFYKSTIDRDYFIIEDVNNNLLIRTQNSIFRYSGGKLDTITIDMPQISDMCLDREGNLWVSTAEGVYNFYMLNFKNHTLSYKTDYMMFVFVDKQNQTWLTTLQGDIIRLNNSKAEKIVCNIPPFNPGTFDESIIDGDDLYLLGGGGVLNYNIRHHKFRWLNLPKKSYRYIVPLPDGSFLIGDYEETYIYSHDKGIIRKYDATDTKQSFTVAATVDKQGRYLLVGPASVVIIDGDSIRYLTDKKLVNCRNAFLDQNGKLWLTSMNNLVVMDEDGHVTIEHSFSNTVIRSIHFTKENLLVVATIDAVYISKNPGNNHEFIRYDQYNGFNVLGAFETPMAEDEKGNVWLLTTGGVVKFNPGDLLRKQHVPLLYMQTMRSSTDNIGWENVNREDIPELEYIDNNIKFNYVALCYSATGNIRYQYRLKGFQEEWSNPVPDREVSFNNLPPGKYEFQLKANVGTDETETEIVSQHFTIYPAFWQTWWFMALIALALLLVTIGITIYIQRRRNRHLIEQLETEKQLNELRVKSIRLRSIPHFNANVLSAIEYYIMNLSKEEANRLLNIYSDFTSRTLREVDKASRTLSDELEYVQLYLKLEKLRFLEKFNYEVDIDSEVNLDVQLPNMILHTYCENAVKHGLSSRSSGGLLKISARQKSDEVVEVYVEDNGVGRVAASRNKNVRSTKQGLDILSRQIEIYNRFNKKKIIQRIDDLYDGDVPNGTRFVIEVPYGFGYQ